MGLERFLAGAYLIKESDGKLFQYAFFVKNLEAKYKFLCHLDADVDMLIQP
jgi:hypothetical protein